MLGGKSNASFLGYWMAFLRFGEGNRTRMGKERNTREMRERDTRKYNWKSKEKETVVM